MLNAPVGIGAVSGVCAQRPLGEKYRRLRVEEESFLAVFFGFSASRQADFLRDHLGPVIRRDHPGVKIMPFDHNRDHRE